jgi:hypothetical protein
VASIWKNETTGLYESFQAWSSRPWTEGEVFADPGWTNPSEGDFSTGNSLSYLLIGPNAGRTMAPIPFSVTPSGASLDVLNLTDQGNGGTFSPAQLTWNDDQSTKDFTYTPGKAGLLTIRLMNTTFPVASRTLSVTSDRWLIHRRRRNQGGFFPGIESIR